MVVLNSLVIFGGEMSSGDVIKVGVSTQKLYRKCLEQEDRLSGARTRWGLTVGAELGLSDQKILVFFLAIFIGLVLFVSSVVL
ncbi:hypothetical protein QL285_093298 [Trifolium repens]|nr:hypothetical protein QL285_093298 [Trifolium repens]